jgi:CRISPR-associated endonuclease/helicase Cas3
MASQVDPLLAKSYSGLAMGAPPPTSARLVPHLRAVVRAGESIVEVAGALILQQLDLARDPWRSRLLRAVKAACLCHDIGKANEGFQKMVRGRISPTQQPVRHELLSALLLSMNEGSVRNWALSLLSDGEKCDDVPLLLDCLIASVGGHHVKLDEEWKKASIALRDGGCGTDLRMLLTHPDLHSLFGEELKNELSFDLTGNKPNYLGELQLPFKFDSNKMRDRLKREPEWWRFAAAVKALLMAADVAGSAMLPEKEDIRRWVAKTLSRRISAQEMHEVVRARLKGSTPRPFQSAVGASEAKVTLVEAGCGTGKTAAAYLWAAKHALGKKLFFCYPTTGTATEGFLGYVAETDVEAELMHSRAIVDLDGLAEVRRDLEADDHLLRINSLRAWCPKVVVCTADTVLALMRNNRRGLYNSPAILSASFVFDELHAYEDRMFAAVVALIKALPGASFLLMTASLPKARKDFLLKELDHMQEVPEPKELEELPRYTFEELAKSDDADEIVRLGTSQKRRVLWVHNTVSRAQRTFERLRDAGLPAKIYHSRFKYEDRVDRHREVIAAFGDDAQSDGFVAVTTQVAEMSLDLDADVLISEVAPVPSLIQRLGRLNRRITPEKPGCPRPAYFVPPEGRPTPAPYATSEIEIARRWLEILKQLQRPLTQADLAEAFNSISPTKELQLELRTEWLDSGYFAIPGPVREAGISVSVILPEDEALCRQDRKEIIWKAIPMNFDSRRGMDNWRELKGNLIAPPNTVDYKKEIGARWL